MIARSKINILMIGLDRTLFTKKSGDSRARHLEYAKYLKSLHIVVYSSTNHKLRKTHEKNLFLYPTNSQTKVHFLTNAIKIGTKIIQNNQIDLIITQDPFLTGLAGQRLARKFNIPLLIHFHGDFLDNPYFLRERPLLHRGFLKIAEKLIHSADGIRVVSSGIAAKLIKRGIPKEKIWLASTPVDLTKFKPRQNKTNQEKNVLFVGRLVPDKNIPLLISVAKKLPTIQFKIIGDGPLRTELKKKSPANVKFLGEIVHDKLPQYFAQTTVIISTSNHESLGKVLIEAAAMGKPVVATATTGSKEIVQNGKTGFLTPVNNTQVFAAKLQKLLNSPALIRKFSANARKLVTEKFNRKKSIERLVKMWQSIIATPKKPRLLMITRKVDANDALAGFAHRWVEKIGKKCEHLEVICLEKGRLNLPKNITVHSLGKEQGKGKVAMMARFQKLAIKIVPNVDSIFCHMNPIYTLAIAPCAKLFRKKILTWYTHKNVDTKLKLLEKVTDKIFTASEKSFRLKTKKLEVVGHGIDTELFSPPTKNSVNKYFKIISVGRISPSKNYETLIHAIAILIHEKKQLNLEIKIVGDAPIAEHKIYLQKLKKLTKKLKLEKYIIFKKAIPNAQLPQYLRQADLFINLSQTGSLDKAVLEAMSCKCIVLTSNEAFARILPAQLYVKNDVKELARKIANVINFSFKQKESSRKKLREIVVKYHNLNQLARKIVNFFQ